MVGRAVHVEVSRKNILTVSVRRESRKHYLAQDASIKRGKEKGGNTGFELTDGLMQGALPKSVHQTFKGVRASKLRV